MTIANLEVDSPLARVGRALRVFLMTLGLLVSWNAIAQGRMDRDGVTLYWGFVPAAIVAQKHALEDLHGGPPRGGGQVHHLVVALFDSKDGSRLDNAVVRAQLREVGIADSPPKYLTPMTIDGQSSYGQMFTVAKEGPYRFRVFVQLPGRKAEIEYAITAYSPHAAVR